MTPMSLLYDDADTESFLAVDGDNVSTEMKYT